MLDTHTINVIKSTVPVLETEGVHITKRFYQTMFEAHPELLNIFNHANQKQGRQQVALANAVYMAALHIDRLEEILPVVKQIAHKHRSLGIRPDQYPIVGKYLLQAIQDVLGEAATPEILDAWAKAYGVIADAFIGIEQEMYQAAEQQPGGWEGFRAFTVQRKERESAVITSFYLVPQDGGELASFEPGQYISVKVHVPGQPYEQIRQYSLSDGPGQPYYRISVKREDGDDVRPAGQVSVYLHEQAQEGDVLYLSAPAGDFQLQRQHGRPVVLISGGVGLTPMMSMLRSLAAEQPQAGITFIHAASNSELHAMRRQVEEIASECPGLSAYYCYSTPTELDRQNAVFHYEGYLQPDWLKEMVPNLNADYYFCGPLPFMQAVNTALDQLEVPVEQRHYEFFGPAASLVASGK
ncbi:NO-inducible flavohemoprotein [Paenibacillus bovis]|uniref:Flavohemoprotein n=1 Tax=Paenibacillus bovis TaxID=1616788 RepID=A0A172ZAT2_9BACL|nr:NO-inducible flavohemoprotein [Paenibacillus bovis]ANF94744.1 nitric oxide dioxygenase [Paenibacillus bovis]